jgi:hypothetical protein
MSYGPPHRSWFRRRPAPASGRQRSAGIGVAVVVLSLSVTATAVAAPKTLRFTVPGSNRAAVAPTKILYAAPAYKNAPSPQALIKEIAANTTVAGTYYSVKAGQNGDTYPFFAVGSNVMTAGSGPTTFSAQVIPTTITFSATGDVYNPNVVNASCGETVTPPTAVLTGPAIARRNWYAGKTFLGHTEYVGSQMRGEFWDWDNPKGSSPNWDVFLNGSNPIDASTTVTDPESDPGTCSAFGEIDYPTFDSSIQATLNGLPASDGIGPTTLPIFITKNVVWTQTSNGVTSCCVLGWHGAFTDSAGNTQTYIVADYPTDGRFGTTEDLADLSHEIAEWANDPFGNNPTPPWGHIGQQPNCQDNLEVGDPLSGTDFAVPPPLPGGQTYHLQELAYFGWFYDYNSAVNGWYSTRGKLTSGASLCS